MYHSYQNCGCSQGGSFSKPKNPSAKKKKKKVFSVWSFHVIQKKNTLEHFFPLELGALTIDIWGGGVNIDFSAEKQICFNRENYYSMDISYPIRNFLSV